MVLGFLYDSAALMGKLTAAMLESGVEWILPPKPKDVKLDVVLVTGAAMGMGRQLALKFAARGASVVLWDINKNQLEETAEEIRREGGTACSYHVDCSDREAVYKTADKVLSEVGRVDILVNNAGIISGKSFLDLTDDDIIKTMDVNVMAHFWTIRKFLPPMIEKNHGHIVTISSAAGHMSGPMISDYAASKHACLGLDLSLKYELHNLPNNNVKTTVICSYFVSTGMFNGVTDTRLPWLFPITSPEHMTDEIMTAILTDRSSLLYPGAIRLMAILQLLLPMKAVYAIVDFLRIGDVMSNFRGRKF